MGSQHNYTQPPQQVSFDGFLFDMDGTLIDSTEAIEKHWHKSGFPRPPQTFPCFLRPYLERRVQA